MADASAGKYEVKYEGGGADVEGSVKWLLKDELLKVC
jgi:hypothetical protein